MANILIGTCGWTDRALLASGWYPPGHRDTEGRLRHYATRFPLVEADSPYYALPTPAPPPTGRSAPRTASASTSRHTPSSPATPPAPPPSPRTCADTPATTPS